MKNYNQHINQWLILGIVICCPLLLSVNKEVSENFKKILFLLCK